MIIFDNGKLSEDYTIDHQEEDWYYQLKENLQFLLDDYSRVVPLPTHKRIGELQEKIEKNDSKVDLHILPAKFFRNKKFRKEVAKKHKDPNFFKNVFSLLLRLRKGQEFVPVGIPYFEKKYHCNLQDLKK